MLSIILETILVAKKIHLTSTDLMNYKDERECNFLLGASCHNLNEIEKANQLKCDYILISPILKDKSGNKKIGWKNLKNLLKILMELVLRWAESKKRLECVYQSWRSRDFWNKLFFRVYPVLELPN